MTRMNVFSVFRIAFILHGRALGLGVRERMCERAGWDRLRVSVLLGPTLAAG